MLAGGIRWIVLLLVLLLETSLFKCTASDFSDKSQSIFTLSDEKRLIKRLLKNYEDAGITGRPVKNTVDKVSVQMSLSLVQILDVDEKNQVLTTSVWLQYHWIDHILKWNPGDYSQLREVRVPSRHVWTPDIVLYNYADERLKEMRDAMVIVQFNGSLSWMPPAIYKSSCKIDIKNFPFDEQTCHLKFGSWTYDGNRLDVSFHNDEAKVLLSEYTPSNEWEIIGHPAIRNVKSYPCCPEYYPDLTFFLFLRRNAAFFSYILVLPCVLLASLTLIIFWLPPESPAKMVLGMNIFVAFFLLLLLLADSTPQASNSVPYIGYYYCLNMILITLSSFLSVIVINLYFRGDRRNRVPKYLRTICYFLSGSCRDSDSTEAMKQSSLHGGIYINKLSEKPQSTEINGHQVASKPVIVSNTSVKRRKRGIHTRFAATSPAGDNMLLLETTTRRSGGTGDLADKELGSGGQVKDCLTLSNLYGDHDLPTRFHRHQTKREANQSRIRSRSLTPHKGQHFERHHETGNNNQHIANTYPTINDGVYSPVYSIALHPTCKYSAPGHNPASKMITANTPLASPDTHARLKHQRHPQTCQVCMQHLSALQHEGQQQVRPLGSSFNDRDHLIPWSASSADPYSAHIAHPLTPDENIHGDTFDAGRMVSTACNICNYVKLGKAKVLVSDRPEPPINGNAMTTEELLRFAGNLQEELRDIQKVIQSFLSRTAKKDAENLILREWRMLAMVMDRIFFTCYLLIHICAAVYLLIPKSAPPDMQRYINEYRLKHYNTTTPFGLKPSNESSIFTPPEANDLERIVAGEDDHRIRLRPDSLLEEERIRNLEFADKTSTNNKVEGYDSLFAEPMPRLSPYQRLVDRNPQTKLLDLPSRQTSENKNSKNRQSRVDLDVT